MNSSLWLHVFQYCSFRDLLVNVTCVSKEWKTLLFSPAANVQLWMGLTDHAIRTYDHDKFLSMEYRKHPTARYKIDWFKECKTIHEHRIASLYYGSYDSQVHDDDIMYIFHVPRHAGYMPQTAEDIRRSSRNWYCITKSTLHDTVWIVRQNSLISAPLFLYYSTPPEKLPEFDDFRTQILGFGHQTLNWLLEMYTEGNLIVCSGCQDVIPPTAIDFKSPDVNHVYCGKCNKT